MFDNDMKGMSKKVQKQIGDKCERPYVQGSTSVEIAKG